MQDTITPLPTTSSSQTTNPFSDIKQKLELLYEAAQQSPEFKNIPDIKPLYWPMVYAVPVEQLNKKTNELQGGLILPTESASQTNPTMYAITHKPAPLFKSTQERGEDLDLKQGDCLLVSAYAGLMPVGETELGQEGLYLLHPASVIATID